MEQLTRVFIKWQKDRDLKGSSVVSCAEVTYDGIFKRCRNKSCFKNTVFKFMEVSNL